MWKHYYQNVERINVIDSSDIKRVEVAKNEVWKILAQEDLVIVPLLVLANKQDIGLLSVKEVNSKMKLETLKGRSWHC